jgi:OTU-like cysteine protease
MSCLFNSMSHFIKEDWCPTGIRQRICDYLEKNLPILEGMETRDVLELEAPTAAHYISNMRNSSTWGGAIEIQCACNIWNARIIVHDIRTRNNNNNNNNKIEFLPLKSENDQPHSLEFNLEWSGGHYEPLH